jgi:hypothetical protein
MYYSGLKVCLLSHQLLSKVESGGAEGRPVPRPATAEDADHSHWPPATAAALRSLLLVLARLLHVSGQVAEGGGEPEREDR